MALDLSDLSGLTCGKGPRCISWLWRAREGLGPIGGQLAGMPLLLGQEGWGMGRKARPRTPRPSGSLTPATCRSRLPTACQRLHWEGRRGMCGAWARPVRTVAAVPAPSTPPLLRHPQAVCSHLGDTRIWGVRGLIVLCVPAICEWHCRWPQASSQAPGHPLGTLSKSQGPSRIR